MDKIAITGLVDMETPISIDTAKLLLASYYDQEQELRYELEDAREDLDRGNLIHQIAVRLALQSLFSSLEIIQSESDEYNEDSAQKKPVYTKLRPKIADVQLLFKEDGLAFIDGPEEDKAAVVIIDGEKSPQLKWPNKAKISQMRSLMDLVVLKIYKEFGKVINQDDLISEISEVMDDTTDSEFY